MSSSRAQSSEENFLCSICLEVFSEPVTTPCGHNFCRRCISQNWDTDGPCTCPLCKQVFHRRPQLKVNTLLKKVVTGSNPERNRRSSLQYIPCFNEVECDICSEPKQKAFKSCVVCMTSLCEKHLQPHLMFSVLKRHQLIEPVENLQDRICSTHRCLLELFCATDQSCVCTVCVPQGHRNHELLSLEEAYERCRSSLLQTQAQCQHMVAQRRQKIQEIQSPLEQSETDTDSEKAVGLQVFTALTQSVQRHTDVFLKELQEKQNRNRRQAQGLLQQLRQEICDLEQSNTEAECLLRSHDLLYFLQHYPALAPPAGLKVWSSVRFELETCKGSVARALSELENSIPQEVKLQTLRLDLLRAQQSAVEVTLDRHTAHPALALSKNLKQVHHTGMFKNLPDSSLRFNPCLIVLGKQSFSSGRFYFEVQVKGKTHWDVGVAQQSINRKGRIALSPERGLWCIRLHNKNEYIACTNSQTRLFPQRAPQRVGVFVDYGRGLVSFYDADSEDLLFSFTGCCFREKLFPCFNPGLNEGGSNSPPLVLVTAVQTLNINQKENVLMY